VKQELFGEWNCKTVIYQINILKTIFKSMRLYLSSYRIGNHPEHLVRLVGSNKRCAVIANASDYMSPQEREEKLAIQIASMNELGFQAEELDLRNYFNNKEQLAEDLKKYGIVWVKGGNSFVLKQVIDQSGFEIPIKKMLYNDEIVYSGYSAGVVILGSTLKGLEMVDDPSEIPADYPGNFSWNGMNILDYMIIPHYKSDHPESVRIDNVIEFLEENNMPYKTIRDGQALIIEGSKEEII
jgi:dipeptidase E